MKNNLATVESRDTRDSPAGPGRATPLGSALLFLCAFVAGACCGVLYKRRPSKVVVGPTSDDRHERTNEATHTWLTYMHSQLTSPGTTGNRHQHACVS